MELAPVTFNANGGLHVLVGRGGPPNQRHFLVCPNTMARASTVWNRLLFGTWKESKPHPEGDWVVEFPDDDSASMELLLNIIHSRFSQVPTTLVLKRLFHLTVLSDKYDLTAHLVPWAKGWIQPIVDEMSQPAHEDESDMKLWIAWELGHSDLFMSISLKYLKYSRIDENGNFQHSPTEKLITLKPVGAMHPPRILGKCFHPQSVSSYAQ